MSGKFAYVISYSYAAQSLINAETSQPFFKRASTAQILFCLWDMLKPSPPHVHELPALIDVCQRHLLFTQGGDLYLFRAPDKFLPRETRPSRASYSHGP
jgi:hypothetical protein